MYNINIIFFLTLVHHTISTTTTSSSSLLLKGNISIEQYNKDTYHNISMNTCYNKWYDLVNYNGRKHFMNMRFANGFPDKVSRDNKDKVLFIHVGKTGGGTIMNHLDNKNISYQQVHLHPVDQQMLNDFKIILIGLRHPVDRLISAYYSSHPLVDPRRIHDGPVEKRYYKCSPTLNDFAKNLLSSSHCGNITRRYPKKAIKMFLKNVHTDTCSYMSGVMEELLMKKENVYVINNANLIDDMNYVSKKLNWGVLFENDVSLDSHIMKTSYKYPQRSAVTYMQLGGYLSLSGETALYNKLQYHFSRLPLFV